ncbi:hypothetical protein FBU30_000597 [Linnemannia zychae]|nr:hypothetical protein FBU30_000597 [Linnemannia zychae]
MEPLTTALALLSAELYFDGRTRLSRDFQFSIPGLKTKLWFQRLVANNDVSIYSRFEDQCPLRPYSVALIFESHSRTWRDLELASNRMAHWYQSQGICAKDRVAILMTNSPPFIISWLALLKIKAIATFINNRITGPVLLHSLKTANSQLLVFNYELRETIEESIPGIQELGYKTIATVTPKEQVLNRFDGHLKSAEERFFGFMEWHQCSAEGFPRVSREDVVIGDAVALIYTSGTTGFPKAAVMDHGRCTSIIGIGQSWVSGSPVVLARKFSVPGFWKDDRSHKAHLMFGNGLRPDIWRKFQERFGVTTVFESYTMSEATSVLFNLASGEDGAGAVGFRCLLVRAFQGGPHIVKVDLDTEELINDKNGFCIEGDQYMRTGDLLYRTKDNFWYFSDCAGDTFRWKGENVSTAEVGDTLGHVEGLQVVQSMMLIDRLGAHAKKRLPSYAIPRFVRICESELEITGTFKNKKVELRKEGYSLEMVHERLYWWTPQGQYVSFGRLQLEQPQAGRARL